MDKDKTIHEVASYICEKYDILLATFNEITAYGKEYFEQKRFHEHHAQQQNRYRLYGNYVKDVYAKTQSLLQENLYNVAYWKDIKNEFSHLIKEKPLFIILLPEKFFLTKVLMLISNISITQIINQCLKWIKKFLM